MENRAESTLTGQSIELQHRTLVSVYVTRLDNVTQINKQEKFLLDIWQRKG